MIYKDLKDVIYSVVTKDNYQSRVLTSMLIILLCKTKIDAEPGGARTSPSSDASP